MRPIDPAGGSSRNSPQSFDPQTNSVTATIGVGAKPVSLAAANGQLWVLNQGDDTASVVDLPALSIGQTLHIGVAAGFAATFGSQLWVPDFQGGSGKVVAIDMSTGQVVRTVAVGSMPLQVSFGLGSGWVGNGPDDTVTRFDPATGAVQHTIRTPGDAGALLATDSAVWVASYQRDTLDEISPGTNSVVGTLALDSEPNGVADLGGYLWVSESGASEVAVVRPG